MAQDNPAVARLRARLDPERPAIAMAAHNPLAAKLAAAAGFDAIWGSGFELSASYAVPDASILSIDTHLELMRAIGEAQDAPVVADLDTGYGNAVNVAYLVPRYAAAGVAAVVIEDKTFPKDSSLRPGGRQMLVAAEEFQGKIEAARIPRGPLVSADSPPPRRRPRGAPARPPPASAGPFRGRRWRRPPRSPAAAGWGGRGAAAASRGCKGWPGRASARSWG